MYDLTAGRRGAPPLWLGPDGTFRDVEAVSPVGLAATTALVRAARWITTRRTLTFERLFPTSPFRRDEPVRTDGLTPEMASGLLGQVRSALDVADIATWQHGRAADLWPAAARGAPLRAHDLVEVLAQHAFG